MTALEQLRGHLSVLRQAVAEGDGERAWLLLDDLEEDLDGVERGRARDRLPIDHACGVCESDCNSVTDWKRRARLAERDAARLAFELQEARKLKDFAVNEIERRFAA